MKIIIFSPTTGRLECDQYLYKAIGCADHVLLKMIHVLSMTDDVEAYINIKEKTGNVHPFMDLFDQKMHCDLMIVYRKVWALPPNVTTDRLIFYSQDTAESPCFSGQNRQGFNDTFNKYDKVVVLSEFHKKDMMDTFKIPEEKMLIIGNGADPQEVAPKKELSFYYSSTPFRGLVVLAKLWKQIVVRYPESNLKVYSSMKIYGDTTNDRLVFEPLYTKLRALKGVEYIGSVPRQELLFEMNRSFMLLYPNTFPETYCNVVMEARSCRTPFITSNKGALQETGGFAGLYVEGNPYTEEYQKEFLNKLYGVIDNKLLYEELQKNCYPIRTWGDWEKQLRNLVNQKD